MAVLQSGAQGLKTCNVSGELENPKDPENPEDLGGLGQVVQGVVGVDAVEDQGEEEGQDAQQVDHVQEGEQELPLEKIRYLFALAGIEMIFSFIVSHAKLTHCYCKGSPLKIQIQYNTGIAQTTI